MGCPHPGLCMHRCIVPKVCRALGKVQRQAQRARSREAVGAEERALWDAVMVSSLRAISNQPGKHLLNGRPCATADDVAALAAGIADAALDERRRRFGENK